MSHCFQCLNLAHDLTYGFEELAGGLDFLPIITFPYVGFNCFRLQSVPITLSHFACYCFKLRPEKLSKWAMSYLAKLL